MFGDVFTSFVLGLLTPLTAVCVLPLYPAFISFLANRISTKSSKVQPVILSLILALGIIVAMFLFGLIFTTFLEFSLTSVIGIISPIAFLFLLVISLFLIFDWDYQKYLPKFVAPKSQNPYLDVFLYGLFLVPIIIPCNPLFIAALFTKSLLVTNFLYNILNFIAFAVGLSFPLILLSLISVPFSQKIIRFLGKYQRKINLVSGIIILIVSLYYLIFVFNPFL
ncbi:cytochrome C biogenesis protein [archaeon]|jgi:cytochrome c-type biogenesis protein|nr:cytochrome C biogenesis protein [archaeon]MBT3730528.1 cytochrome C biogenesis protein [archaeon]MBT4669406.1 cytochrome C biogenesis protein [archaeon]MBT5029841.1 cytochrome C biogenesis protein [archaeon]MBT5288054.1 cytochrome C biogenesis protein [archaeon]